MSGGGGGLPEWWSDTAVEVLPGGASQVPNLTVWGLAKCEYPGCDQIVGIHDHFCAAHGQAAE